jgi:hypothetical protein
MPDIHEESAPAAKPHFPDFSIKSARCVERPQKKYLDERYRPQNRLFRTSAPNPIAKEPDRKTAFSGLRHQIRSPRGRTAKLRFPDFGIKSGRYVAPS